ncbi:hypothetical protein G9463_13605 [Haloarcula sp. JP-Z28]|uniref:hypothetical protein n=1 Tax=Haloarcula sp. JP-Z28 TaxID=2716715 RepID=UPI001404D035|nr:hypothetical protein [Haloarcula sp. JP-Z28]NHN64325.1 hypothetical protein [Haloarcula sp. JP-Z28]
MQSEQPATGTELCWDHEDCPRDDCDGGLQQQDRFNVLCLACEGVWTYVKTSTAHLLQTADCETVATKPIAMSDGGRVSEADIESILDELKSFEGIDLTKAEPGTVERFFDAQDWLMEAIDAELDDDDLPQATHIWWNDQAEFHLYCADHYFPIANEQWTGFTEVDDPQAVTQAARDRLDSGVPCEKCHSEVLYGRRDELLEERDLA